ncbi:hypothetical protein EMIT047CA2_90171 [Pseudomonas soli]
MQVTHKHMYSGQPLNTINNLVTTIFFLVKIKCRQRYPKKNGLNKSRFLPSFPNKFTLKLWGQIDFIVINLLNNFSQSEIFSGDSNLRRIPRLPHRWLARNILILETIPFKIVFIRFHISKPKNT